MDPARDEGGADPGGGGPTETITVRTTSHGPIVSDVLPSAKDGGVHAPTFGAGASGDVYALSLAWTGLRPSKTADALLGLNKARDFTQFRTALRDLAAPSQNVIYADVDGHIGYQAPGVIPVRAPSGTPESRATGRALGGTPTTTGAPKCPSTTCRGRSTRPAG